VDVTVTEQREFLFSVHSSRHAAYHHQRDALRYHLKLHPVRIVGVPCTVEFMNQSGRGRVPTFLVCLLQLLEQVQEIFSVVSIVNGATPSTPTACLSRTSDEVAWSTVRVVLGISQWRVVVVVMRNRAKSVFVKVYGTLFVHFT